MEPTVGAGVGVGVVVPELDEAPPQPDKNADTPRQKQAAIRDKVFMRGKA
jgi:hypothetical protein